MKFRRAAALTVLAVAGLASAAGAQTAAQSPSPAPSGSPLAVLGTLGYRVSSVSQRSSVGSAAPVKARGTFVIVRIDVKNLTSVVQRARLESSFVSTRDGARYPVATAALVAMKAASHLSTSEITGEIPPGFSQTFPLAFDVPRGMRGLSLHVPASYPDVGRQTVLPLALGSR